MRRQERNETGLRRGRRHRHHVGRSHFTQISIDERYSRQQRHEPFSAKQRRNQKEHHDAGVLRAVALLVHEPLMSRGGLRKRGLEDVEAQVDDGLDGWESLQYLMMLEAFRKLELGLIGELRRVRLERGQGASRVPLRQRGVGDFEQVPLGRELGVSSSSSGQAGAAITGRGTRRFVRAPAWCRPRHSPARGDAAHGGGLKAVLSRAA
jgi:hypothetical protein